MPFISASNDIEGVEVGLVLLSLFDSLWTVDNVLVRPVVNTGPEIVTVVEAHDVVGTVSRLEGFLQK